TPHAARARRKGQEPRRRELDGVLEQVRERVRVRVEGEARRQEETEQPEAQNRRRHGGGKEPGVGEGEGDPEGELAPCERHPERVHAVRRVGERRREENEREGRRGGDERLEEALPAPPLKRSAGREERR